MKQFKEGDITVIVGEIITVTDSVLEVKTKSHNFLVDIDCNNLQHISEIQQSQFTDEEFEIIKNDIYYVVSTGLNGVNLTPRENLLSKINNIFQSPEEKQFLEMAEKLGYKVEKL